MCLETRAGAWWESCHVLTCLLGDLPWDRERSSWLCLNLCLSTSDPLRNILNIRSKQKLHNRGWTSGKLHGLQVLLRCWWTSLVGVCCASKESVLEVNTSTCFSLPAHKHQLSVALVASSSLLLLLLPEQISSGHIGGGRSEPRCAEREQTSHLNLLVVESLLSDWNTLWLYVSVTKAHREKLVLWRALK